MPRYLVQASYAPSAFDVFVSKPQDRTPVIRALIEKMGGTLESLDFCLGEYDAIGIMSLPDDVSAAAVAMATCAPGHLKTYKTTRLLSAQEFVEAQRKAQGIGHQPPAKG